MINSMIYSTELRLVEGRNKGDPSSVVVTQTSVCDEPSVVHVTGVDEHRLIGRIVAELVCSMHSTLQRLILWPI